MKFLIGGLLLGSGVALLIGGPFFVWVACRYRLSRL